MKKSKEIAFSTGPSLSPMIFNVSSAYDSSTIDDSKLNPSILGEQPPVDESKTLSFLSVLGNNYSEGLDVLILETNMRRLDKPISDAFNSQGYVSSSVSSLSEILADTMSSTQKYDLPIEWNRKIRHIVESGDIERTRGLLDSMDASRINYYGLQNWKKLLESPKVTVSEKGTGRPFRNSIKILQDKKRECAGKWLAIIDDKFLGCHESKVTLYKNLKNENKLKGAMFFFVEK